jgi:hypothetical protein
MAGLTSKKGEMPMRSRRVWACGFVVAVLLGVVPARGGEVPGRRRCWRGLISPGWRRRSAISPTLRTQYGEKDGHGRFDAWLKAATYLQHPRAWLEV